MTTSGLSPRDVADRLEIAEVLDRYAAAIDARDWSALGGVFTSDATLDYSAFGGPAGACAEVIDWIRASLTPIPVTQHLITNRLVSVDGDTARSRCSFFNPLAAADGSMLFVGGYYVDELRRTADGWRIASRVLELAWQRGMPA